MLIRPKRTSEVRPFTMAFASPLTGFDSRRRLGLPWLEPASLPLRGHPMTRFLLLKTAVALASAGAGLLAGTLLATPALALLNALATEGPYFPAPLVAFGLLALPISVLLVPVQVLLVAYETMYLRDLGRWLLPLVVAAGSLAGFGWFLGLQSPRASAWLLIGLLALGVLQAGVVFGLYWLAERLLDLVRLWRWSARTSFG